MFRWEPLGLPVYGGAGIHSKILTFSYTKVGTLNALAISRASHVLVISSIFLLVVLPNHQRPSLLPLQPSPQCLATPSLDCLLRNAAPPSSYTPLFPRHAESLLRFKPVLVPSHLQSQLLLSHHIVLSSSRPRHHALFYPCLLRSRPLRSSGLIMSHSPSSPARSLLSIPATPYWELARIGRVHLSEDKTLSDRLTQLHISSQNDPGNYPLPPELLDNYFTPPGSVLTPIQLCAYWPRKACRRIFQRCVPNYAEANSNLRL